MKIYCINLAHRTDRWESMEVQFEEHGLTVERFNAIEGTDIKRMTRASVGNNGCTLSHWELVSRARVMNLPAIMVLEDDAVLCENFQQHLDEVIEALDIDCPDWDMLMFGGSHKEPLLGSHPLYRQCTKTLTTHGYIIRQSLYDTVIKIMQELDTEVDGYYSSLQPSRKIFVANPPLAWQRADYSDIQQRWMDYRHLQSNDQ